jgi:lysyl-tRNA synthetase class 2
MHLKEKTQSWRPSAPLENLTKRAHIFKQIRDFFLQRHVLEMETPLLANSTATDAPIASFMTTSGQYLQTSPEFFMKRLLAAGSGAIYQLGKAFRAGEQGHKHNSEFTLLEWYRPGFDHHALMHEVDELLQTILHTLPGKKLSYAETFQTYLQLDPHRCSLQELQHCAARNNLTIAHAAIERDDWLDLLLTHLIEPQLGINQPLFIYDYPASQAALARIRKENDIAVGERFEVYVKGIELANGYHELLDANEQRQRFIADNDERKTLGYPQIRIDEYFLEALKHGMPACAGVALGVDRLVMLALNAASIADVISFDWPRV